MATPSPSSVRIFKSALWGLAMGLFLGAGFLIYGALDARNAQCEGLSESECELVKEVRASHARIQSLTAVALVLSGAAALLIARGRRSSKESP